MAFTFQDIIGNDSLKEELAKLIRQGQMPHTSMMHGKEGSAKLRIALAAARMLLCQNPGEEDSCGICSSCKQTEQLAHPDLHFCFPLIGSEVTSDDYVARWRTVITAQPDISLYDWLEQGEFSTTSKNLKGNISTKNIRNAVQKLVLKSYEGGAKVLLLWMPELMGNEGNRVLKIFEEPPSNTFIIMVSERLEAILPTILSRTQRFRVDKYSTDEVIAILTDKGIEIERAKEIALMTDGNLNEAFKLSEGKEEEEGIWNFQHWSAIIRKNDAQALYKMADQFIRLNLEQRKYFFKHCAITIDLAIKLKISTSETLAIRPVETEFIRNFANAFEVGQMYALISVLDKAIFYVERNANAKILFIALSYLMEKHLKTSAVQTA